MVKRLYVPPVHYGALEIHLRCKLESNMTNSLLSARGEDNMNSNYTDSLPDTTPACECTYALTISTFKQAFNTKVGFKIPLLLRRSKHTY
jgi:hypothetical protein